MIMTYFHPRINIHSCVIHIPAHVEPISSSLLSFLPSRLQPSQEVILPYSLPPRHTTTLDNLVPPLERHDSVVAFDRQVLALLVDGDRERDVLGEFRLFA